MSKKKTKTTKDEMITPQKAEKLLRKMRENGINRSVKWSHVRKLARLMNSGEWNDKNPAAIYVDWDGNVIDGQHRLEAVILSGIPRTFSVTRNCDPDGFIGFDENARRTAADVYQMSGGSRYYKNIPTVARVILQGGMRTKGFISNNEVTRFALTHRDTFETYAGMFYASPYLKGLCSSGLVAAFVVAAMIHGDELVHPMAERITSNEFEGKLDPMRALYRWICNCRTNSLKMTQKKAYGGAVTAIRACLSERELHAVRVSTRDFKGAEVYWSKAREQLTDLTPKLTELRAKRRAEAEGN